MRPEWTEARLAQLPVKRGFRQRGVDMNRLETFTDAAFAFSVTLIVISVDDLPRSYEEFIEALKFVPSFLVCFSQLMLFWWAHHVWSRRFGLEDGLSMFLSLCLVATVLVYIFPLRVIFTVFFSFATQGWLPPPFNLNLNELGVMFVVFGSGFALMSGLVAGLNFVALRAASELCLNAVERYDTATDILIWIIVGLTGLLSVAIALISNFSPIAGYAYWTLAISTPLATAIRNRRRPTMG